MRRTFVRDYSESMQGDLFLPAKVWVWGDIYYSYSKNGCLPSWFSYESIFYSQHCIKCDLIYLKVQSEFFKYSRAVVSRECSG